MNLLKKKIIIIPLCIIGVVFIVIISVDWSDKDVQIELDSKFPLPDYLYQNSTIAQQEQTPPPPPKQEAPEDPYKHTQDLLDLAKSKIEDQYAKLAPKDEKPKPLTPSSPLILLEQPKQQPSQDHRTNDSFVWEKANERERQRIEILSQRITGFEAPSKERKESIEYGVDSFSNYNKRDIGTNEHKLLRTITADKMIPAFLVTPISSALSGKVVAQTETNIYGTMGRAVLIPKGSKVIGYYKNNNKIGEYRLQIAWTRIITPQGIHILLTNARGADVKGYSGLIGEVISRNFEKYGMPLLVSTLSNGLLLAGSAYLNKEAGETSNLYGQYALTELSNSMKNDVSAVVEQILRDNAKLNPIIIIREGSRVFISPNTDIFIPVPRGKEVLAEFFKEKQPQQEESNESNNFGD